MSINKKLEKITTRILIGILIIFFVSIVVRLVTRVVIKVTGVNNQLTELVFFDQPDLIDEKKSRLEVNKEDVIQEVNWAELYPFAEDVILASESSENINKNNLYIKLINKLKKVFDYWTSELLIFRTKLTEIGSSIENIFNWNIAMPQTGVVELNNGHFTSFQKKCDVTEIKNSLSDFNKFCLDNKTPFVYIVAPHKNCKYDNQLKGNIDFTNENADILIEKLTDENVNVLDLREELHKAGLNHYDCFYKTDHHWTSETGLWATSVIGKYLNEEFDMDIDLSVFSPDKFGRKLYKNNYLGSWGRKVSLGKAKPDDFELIYPMDNYRFEYKMIKKQFFLYEDSGDFSVLLNLDELGDGSYYDRSSYGVYIYGDNESFITNLSENNGKRILLIGDSFSEVIAPFLALGVTQLDRIDLRHMTGSLRSFITQNEKFDCIVVMYNAGSVNRTNNINYKTHEDMHDFR